MRLVGILLLAAVTAFGAVACGGEETDDADNLVSHDTEQNVTSAPVPALGVYRLENGGDRSGQISLSAANGGSITFTLSTKLHGANPAKTDGRATRKDGPYLFQKDTCTLSLAFDNAAKTITVAHEGGAVCASDFGGAYALAR